MKKKLESEQRPDWKKPLKQLNDVLEQFELSVNRDQDRRTLIREIDREIQKATLSAEKVYKLILNEGLNEVNADYGYIFKIEEDKFKRIAMRGDHNVVTEFPVKNSLSEQTILKGETINIEDVTKLPSDKYFRFHEDAVSELSIPIKDYRGVKNFGIFNIERKIKGKFDKESVAFCELLKGQIAITMEHVKVWEGVNLINELSIELLSGKMDLAKIYEFTLNKVLKLLDFDLGQILLVDRDKLIIMDSSSKSDVGLIVGTKDSVCGYYIISEKGREPLIIDDIENSPYIKYYKWLLGKVEQRKMRSEFVVPLMARNKKVVGVINIEDPQPFAFSEFDKHLLKIIGNMIAQAIESGTHLKTIQDIKNARGAAIALTQLGYLSLGFLHDFGGKIGDAKARLAEFKKSVSNLDLPEFDNISGLDFIEKILQYLRDSENVIKTFHDKFNPKLIDTSLKRIALIKFVQGAILKAEVPKPENILITFTFLDERKNIECFLTEQFGEVLDCLLNNAKESMRNGGKIDVQIDLEDPLTVRLVIQDNGIGMNEDVKSKMYDYGFTTKLKSKRGQGIGLWYVKMYVDAFSGKIICDSTVGKGTTFYLYFPLAIEEESSLNL